MAKDMTRIFLIHHKKHKRTKSRKGEMDDSLFPFLLFVLCFFVVIKLKVQPQSELNLSMCAQADIARDRACDGAEDASGLSCEGNSRLKPGGQGRIRIGEVGQVEDIEEFRP